VTWADPATYTGYFFASVFALGGGAGLGFQNAGRREAMSAGALLSSGNQRPIDDLSAITVIGGCLSKIPITSVAQQSGRVFGGAREAMEAPTLVM